jgi:hypothetical protein
MGHPKLMFALNSEQNLNHCVSRPKSERKRDTSEWCIKQSHEALPID